MPFSNRLECLKCGQDRFSWLFHDGFAPDRTGGINCDEREHLHVRCERCGWGVLMEPKDA